MRAIGIILIIASVIPLAWVGFVQFGYISEVQSRYDQHIVEVENRYNESIEQPKKSLDAELTSLENSGQDSSTIKTLKEQAKQTNDTMTKSAKDAFEAAMKMQQDALDEGFGYVRSWTYFYHSAAIGIFLLVVGGFLAFRRKRSQ